MSFAIVTDTSANLPIEYARENDITIIPFSFYIDGEENTCIDAENYDGAAYYAMLRAGKVVTTSQITPARYIEYMSPILEAGKDVLLICLSSGVSGAYSSSQLAARELAEKYPERKVISIDSRGASMGEGLLAYYAVEDRAGGMTIDETAAHLLETVPKMNQLFTVDDLKYLKRSGRISGATAAIGSVLNIKPLLTGNKEGKIVSFAKVRSRKKSVRELARLYAERVVDAENQIIAISHADCKDEAEALRELVCAEKPPKQVVMVCHEPATGSHVGPGMLAVYFLGNERIL
ncbi:MAG: DegV family protein [Clostridia bacterium]|nr:DegV family protein [Clostridia bacterium]